MPDSEFDLIKQYFATPGVRRTDVALGIGDDAAVLSVPAGMELVTTIDTLVSGVHFPEQTAADAIAWKTVAVNLSDLAAMGAEPAWATLSLTLPAADRDWLQSFSRGLFELLTRYNIQLIGGDTVRGPLSVTMQLHGFVKTGQALRRDGARCGDRVFVSGPLGDAGLALRILQDDIVVPARAKARLLQRLDRPEPRVELGLALRTLATAAIDISDGLTADLGHLCNASRVAATVSLAQLPLSDDYRRCIASLPAGDTGRPASLWDTALSAGDDYELCFTVPADKQPEAERLGACCIGVIDSGDTGGHGEVRFVGEDGTPYTPAVSGYDHFGT